MALSDARSGGHLITITYTMNTMRIRISHAICDAYGMNLFISFLLCDYFSGEDGEEAYFPLSNEATEDELAIEYANPFDYLSSVEKNPEIKNVSSFTFGEDEVSEKSLSFTRVILPRDAYLSFAKENESSVAAVGAWILMRTILNIRDTGSLPLSVAIPCDTRNILGCKGNMRNCNIDLKLTMHLKMMDKSSDYQLSCLRSQLFANMYEPVVMSRMNSSKERWLEACKFHTIRERTDYYETGEGLDEVPIVTYPGSLDIGKYEEKVKEFHPYAPIFGKAGISMAINYHHNNFELNISSNLKDWDKYLDSLSFFLKEIGMPTTIDRISMDR